MEYFQSIKTHFDRSKVVNVVKGRKDPADSPKAEVGEIDTRAPIQSVRAAVSLFGETISTPNNKQSNVKKPKSHFEGVLDKEAEFHIAQKELGKFKSQAKNAEHAANKALPDLEKAMKTLMELQDKIKAINTSKDLIAEETEVLRIKAIKLEEAKSSNQEVNNVTRNTDDISTIRQDYMDASDELDAAKQELRILHREFEAAIDAKCNALHMVEEAYLASKVHTDKVVKLSQEIESVKESLDQVMQSTKATLEEHAKVSADKDEEERRRRIAKEEVERKLNELLEETEKEGFDGVGVIEMKIEETNREIEDIKEQIRQEKESLSEVETEVYTELDDATEAFKEIERENQLIEEEIEAINVELAVVVKEIAQTMEKETMKQTIAGNLQEELEELKLLREELLESETNDADACIEMKKQLEQKLLEVQQAQEEEQELLKTIEKLQREVRSTKEIELKKLEKVMKEAEEANLAEKTAQNELKILSERKHEALEEAKKDQKKGMSKEEYMALKERVSESEKMAETKVESAMAELEALKASKNEAEKKLNEKLKEIEKLEGATEEAFSQAEMAEASRCIAVCELQRQREKEHHCSS